ncbi:MAG: hypothetical protein D3913_10455 [Candidatus Electrothrix sp. LOE1_4_5]|nr:hypothetical protein [Candidatus Electrothrix sp. AX1]MCI5118358.1 hypothetical protein [Candidatus Electrothrix gigas]MCI5183673.1 hypothetical protein [Candidatus Electrothrix gigas]MCI5191295.1 hypothetical protein [Candidatus Electrothrix gigas]
MEEEIVKATDEYGLNLDIIISIMKKQLAVNRFFATLKKTAANQGDNNFQHHTENREQYNV